MISRERAVLPGLVQRPKMLRALLASAGILLSLFAGYQDFEQYEAIERLRLGEAVDAHFVTAKDHVAARENLAVTVSALFAPPPLPAARPLGNFGHRVLVLAPDVTTVGWLPEVETARAGDALKSMEASGVANPRFIGPDDRSIVLEELDRPLYPIVDIAPERNRWILGVDAGAFPERLVAIRRARETRTVTRTTPLRLVQAPDTNALLLYAPVFADDGRFLGVMGFGYKVDEFFRAALTSAGIDRGFNILVYTENVDVPLVALAANGAPLSAAPPDQRTPQTVFERKADFGGRELKFVYTIPRDLTREGLMHGLWIGGAGLALTFAAIALVGFISNRATTLAHEVTSRRSAEDRLKVVIHELNHRVRNVMSVAQAVVRLSFTPGSTLSDVQKTCEGRLQALSNAMSLLTASEWKGIGLRSLVSEEIVPFAGRIVVRGPDIALKARSAQTFALLFYELATNAAKHGALSVPNGKVLLEWTVDHSGSDPVFRMTWREMEGPVIGVPTRRGFGELLVRRIAPRDVAGRSKVSYAAQGFEYELEAPLRELIDVRREEGAA